MTPIKLAVVLTGLVPYLLLIIGIIKGKVKQSFATWILWLTLDGIMLRSIIVQDGNPVLFSIFTIGTLVVTIFLIVYKQFSWGKFESFVAGLVFICIIAYLVGGPYLSTIATAIALDVAGIPQIIDTYKDPKSTSTKAYILFTLSSGLSLVGLHEWSVQNWLPATNAMIYCLLVTLLSIRRN